MFFVLSKIIAFFLNPLNLLVFIGLSLSFLVLFKWKKTSFFVAIGFLAFSILIGLTPISYNLLKNLEDNSFAFFPCFSNLCNIFLFKLFANK